MAPVYKGFPVDQLIPDGTELTDIQRSYLEATAYLFSKSDHVKMIDVARLMGKPTGSVHSAMMALSQRGILKTDHSGTIRLLSNETEEAEPEEAEPEEAEPEETEPEKAELKETEPEERETESAGSKKLGTEESIPEESSPDEPLVEGYIVVDGQLVSRQGEIIPDAPFTVLHLSARPYNALAREQNRIKVTEHETLMISDLVKLNRGQLTSLRYLGAKSMSEIISELKNYLANPEPPRQTTSSEMMASLQEAVPEAKDRFAQDYEIVDYVIRHKETLAVVENAPVQVLGLKIRNQAALLVNGYRSIADLIHVEFGRFREKTKLGKKTTQEISDSLEQYLLLHRRNYGQDETADVIVTPESVMEYFGEHEFSEITKEKLEAAFADVDETVLNNILEILHSEGKLVSENNVFHKPHISFFQYAFAPEGKEERRPNASQLDVLRWRSLGNTLEEVANGRGMTRERIRQIEQRAFNILTKKGTLLFSEDAYAYLFRTYYLERDAFIQAFGQTQQTWYYLTVRYDRGKRPISEALEDPNLSMADRYAVEKFIHRDDFFLDGRYVPGTRSGIEDYLAEKYCQDEMNFDDFMVLCDRFIRENELPLEEVSGDYETQKKTRLNRVSRSANILWKQNQRLRYYNIEGGDFTELLETLDLSRYHDIEISTQKLMTDHPDVMRRYDIRDEYELHNLLKKIHAEKENPSLVFGRMPGLVFGKFNRDEAVKEIMFALAPVSQEDLVEMISLEYGFRENTIVANLLGCISEYLHHGMYSIEYEDMPQEQMDIMSSVLTDDLYTFEELKDLYLRSVGNPDTTLLSSYNMKRLGYSAGASYFVRSSLSAEEYFDRLLLEKDRVDITEISRRFTGITAFSTRLSKHRHELDILEYEPYKYVNIRLLEKSGFTRDRLRIYADRVCAFIEPFIRNNTDPDTVLIGNNGKDAYFSVISLKNAGFTDELDMLGFGDRFCASILREDDRFSWQRIGGMAVFNPNRTFFTTGKFLAAYVAKEGSISLDELILQVYKSFGISIDKSRAQDKVTKDNVYYDPVIQKLYADYETFLKETEELRRNNDETSRLQTDNQIQ